MLNNKLLVILLVFTSFFVFLPIKADSVAPLSLMSINPTVPNGENNWYTTYPSINITATDNDTGVSAINWKINSNPWQTSNFTSGLNVVQNPSFEQGYIQSWNFKGPFLSVGLKTSLFEKTGNYAASIISLGFWDKSYFENTDYLTLLPLQTYNFSFYFMSVTSWLDNGFYQVVSVSGGQETILASGNNIDLKLNYKEISGSFITTSDSTARVFIRVGLQGLGHIVIDDVFISTAGDSPSVNFILDNEGVNTILYYSEDAAGNIEGTRQVQVKIDTLSPSFSGFEAFDAESLQKFASKIEVSDQTSGLVQDPALFNYAVDGFTAGYFENYNTCSGDFTQDQYIVLDTNYLLGANLGTVITPQIDYCDTNWVNCKRLNFYVKDIAGNIGTHSICVNGPYITSNFGDTFAREGFYQMGLGDVNNLWGTALSGGPITDVSSFSNVFVPLYSNPPYLNNTYSYYLQKLDSISSFTSNISTNNGVFKVDGETTINTELVYTSVSQVVFINGDLHINANITADDSRVFYIVSGNIYVDNLVTLVESNLISTSQIFTASSADLAERLTIKGMLVAQELVFTRNTDRTLGASEIINFPINLLLQESFLTNHPIYWREILD